MIVVRYAHPAVGFEHEGDARRRMLQMRERLVICAVASPGQDPPDRVRLLAQRSTASDALLQTGDLGVLGLHLHSVGKSAPGPSNSPALLARPHAGQARH